jgi:hypothetical protein
LRYFFSRHTPPFTRVLLIESGSRDLFDDLIPGLREIYGDEMRLDLVTCYAGVPKGFRENAGEVYRVTDYAGREGRRRLYRILRGNRYTVAGIICSGEPIMTKWKWALAARVPAKFFVLNENGDYFWCDWSHWRTIRHFAAFRLGLTGASGIRTLARLAVFPLALLYLIGYAAFVHLRRWMR